MTTSGESQSQHLLGATEGFSLFLSLPLALARALSLWLALSLSLSRHFGRARRRQDPTFPSHQVGLTGLTFSEALGQLSQDKPASE